MTDLDKLLPTLWNIATVAAVVWDCRDIDPLKMRLVIANPAACRLVGIEQTDVGKDWYELGWADDPDNARNALEQWQCAQTGEPSAPHLIAGRRVGVGRMDHWQVQYAPFDDRQVLILFSQVTDVVERAHEAEQGLEDMTAVIRAISHDMREPLRVMAGMADMALDARRRLTQEGSGSTEQLDDLLTRIARAARRGSARLDGFRAFAKLTLTTMHRNVSLMQALAMAVDGLETEMRGAGAKFDLPTRDYLVRGHLETLTSVFQNLLGNALKYRADRPLRVAVTFQRQPDGLILVEVADNGVGFDDGEYGEFIFGLGHRLQKNSAGDGFGLALVRKAIEKHGGRVWATSKPGVGSTFHFTLFGDS